jgi:hypothetical protein
MDCELLLRKAQPRLGGREISEEELQESRVTELGWFVRWAIQPRPEGRLARGRGGEHTPAPSGRLANLVNKAEAGESRRLAIEQRVRKRPEVAERRADVALQLVGRRGPLAREQAEHEIRRRRQAKPVAADTLARCGGRFLG